MSDTQQPTNPFPQIPNTKQGRGTTYDDYNLLVKMAVLDIRSAISATESGIPAPAATLPSSPLLPNARINIDVLALPGGQPSDGRDRR
jgi:hypothetical protein